MKLPESGLAGYISIPAAIAIKEGPEERDFLRSIAGVGKSPLNSKPAVYLVNSSLQRGRYGQGSPTGDDAKIERPRFCYTSVPTQGFGVAGKIG